MSLEQKDGDRVAVALFPVDYAPVEVVTDAGEEILQQDFSEAQLFLHSIQELERVRMETKKSKKRKMGSGSSDAATSADEKKPRMDGEEKSGSPGQESVDPADDQGDDIVMKDEPAEESKENVKGGKKSKKKPAGELENGVEKSTENGTSEHVADEQDDATAVDAAVGGDVSGQEEEDEEEVIDPRIHYRPMVAELQGSIIELNQLINTIDLIRRREYLEDRQCIRENTVEKKDEMEYLVEAKAQQLKDSSNILLAGVDALTLTVEKESNFFDGVSEMIRKWKICAPIHGNIPKPFRAGEPLAVDCSFVSAGSRFVPPTRSVADLSFAELSRTEKGLVCIKTPEEYMARTIQVELRSLVNGASGSYTLPAPKTSPMTRAMLDRLENTPDDLETLDERNTCVLKMVQFSVFCEELFYTVMQEALWSSGNWSDSALSLKKPVAKKSQRNDDAAVQGPGNVSVVEILDDEIRLRLRDHYEMTLRLLDARAVVTESSDGPPQTQQGSHGNCTSANGHASSKAATARLHTPHSEEEFLHETCRFAVLLLQQEIRERHGRNQISRGLLFTSADNVSATGVPVAASQVAPTDADKTENGGVLAAVVNTISHNLLQDEIARYLDELSARLAYQNAQSSSTGRILEDGLNQPICDSVRGIYVSPRWKTCPYDSTLAAFDLNVGKNFTTEILISGTKIRFEDGPGTIREISSLSGLKKFVEKTICCQLAQALHRDFASLGLKQSSVDLDRTSVRLFVSGEWNGSCIGDGRVPDSKPTSCMYFEPYLTSEMTVSIKCVLQAVDTTSLSDLGTSRKNGKGEPLNDLEWERIPGNSDMAKIVWLLQKTTGLPSFFAAPADGSTAVAVVPKTA